MFNRRRGKWISFDPLHPNAQSVALTTPCISTSAEMAGHFQTIVVPMTAFPAKSEVAKPTAESPASPVLRAQVEI
jgi:hypothetical protein